METVITAMSDVFSLAGTCVTEITSQPILLFCLAASLVPVGISIFGRLKRVARGQSAHAGRSQGRPAFLFTAVVVLIWASFCVYFLRNSYNYGF